MQKNSFTYDELSKHIDRDRTSFYYYEAKHKDNYKYWAEYKELYDNLKKSYLGIDNMAMTKEDMLKVFKDNGIVNQEAAPFMLSFKIGNIEEFIYTRELEATIKFALDSDLTLANFFTVTPQPKTPLYPLAEKENKAAHLGFK